LRERWRSTTAIVSLALEASSDASAPTDSGGVSTTVTSAMSDRRRSRVCPLSVSSRADAAGGIGPEGRNEMRGWSVG
jgi:hypothetical protein